MALYFIKLGENDNIPQPVLLFQLVLRQTKNDLFRNVFFLLFLSIFINLNYGPVESFIHLFIFGTRLFPRPGSQGAAGAYPSCYTVNAGYIPNKSPDHRSKKIIDGYINY